MEKSTRKLYNWAIQKANSPKAPFWIGALFSLEIILFIPLDAILMFFCLQNRKKIPLYIAIAAAASVVSGVIGYLLGHFLWDLIGTYVVPHLVSTSLFDKVSLHLQQYENWAVFFGSLLPFPLKAISMTAGVFHLAFLPFVVYLLTARVARFALVGGAMVMGGEKLKDFVDRHFHRIVVVVGAKIAAAFLFFWALAH